MKAQFKRNIVLLICITSILLIVGIVLRVGKLDCGPFSDMASIVESLVVIMTVIGVVYYKFSSEKMKMYFTLPSSSVKLQSNNAVPVYTYFDVNVLIIRVGTELKNKIVKLSTDGRGEACLSMLYNTSMGFEFKVFLQLKKDLDLSNSEREYLTAVLQRDMKYLGYQHVGRLSLDGKLWFLMPDVMLIGVVPASERETILNNIYYPTLPNLIRPHLEIHMKMPMSYNLSNFIDEMIFILEIKNAHGDVLTRKKFNLVSENEMLNIAEFKIAVDNKYWSKMYDATFNFSVEIRDGNHNAELLNDFHKASEKLNLEGEMAEVAKLLKDALDKRREQKWSPSLLKRLSVIKRHFDDDNCLSSTIDQIEHDESLTIEILTEKMEALHTISQQNYDLMLLDGENDKKFKLINDAEKSYENILKFDEVDSSYSLVK